MTKKILLGDYLRHLRENAGLSIQELGRQTKLIPGYIDKVENNSTIADGSLIIPNPQILSRMAPVLGVSYYDLMRAAGYIGDVIEKPDLYQLLLAGLVKVNGIEITDVDFAKKIVNKIDSALADLKDEWDKIKTEAPKKDPAKVISIVKHRK